LEPKSYQMQLPSCAEKSLNLGPTVITYICENAGASHRRLNLQLQLWYCCRLERFLKEILFCFYNAGLLTHDRRNCSLIDLSLCVDSSLYECILFMGEHMAWEQTYYTFANKGTDA
jgi:hypothetical protein